MTPQARSLAIALIENPPAGSKLAAAKELGIDLTLLLENLELTPAERVQKLEEIASFLEQVRRDGKSLR